MGLFGGKSKAPTLQLPEAPKYGTAEDYFGNALNFGKTNTPEAFSARENALKHLSSMSPSPEFFSKYDLVSPETLSPSYFNQFGPTSFEEALSNQYFQNILPESERKIKHGLSLSGIESSPVLAEMLSKNYNNLAVPIGEYLSNLGQQRAQSGLQRYSELLNLGQRRGEMGIQGLQQQLALASGIDPFSTYSNYLNTDIDQSNMQTTSDYQYALMKAQQDYQNALESAKQKSNKGGLLGSGAGAALAIGLAPFTAGASLSFLPMAASLGGSVGAASSGYGGSSPLSFADALSLGGIPGMGGMGKTQPVNPTSTSRSLYDKLYSPTLPVFGGQ